MKCFVGQGFVGQCFVGQFCRAVLCRAGKLVVGYGKWFVGQGKRFVGLVSTAAGSCLFYDLLDIAPLQETHIQYVLMSMHRTKAMLLV